MLVENTLGWGRDVSLRCDVDMEVDASREYAEVGWGGVGMLAFVVKLTWKLMLIGDFAGVRPVRPVRPLEPQKRPECQTSSFLRPGKFIANNSTKLTTSKITEKTRHL